MSIKLGSLTTAAMASGTPVAGPEEEEYYSSWSLFLVCMLLILSLWTSYYLQIKRIRAVHETLVSIFAGMLVGLIVRLAPGTMIKEMLVSDRRWRCSVAEGIVLVALWLNTLLFRLSDTPSSSTYCCHP